VCARARARVSFITMVPFRLAELGWKTAQKQWLATAENNNIT